MRIRTSRRAHAWDADALAFFNRSETNGKTFVGDMKKCVNSMILAMKADSVWSLLDELWMPFGTDIINEDKIVYQTTAEVTSTTAGNGYEWIYYSPYGPSMGITDLGSLNGRPYLGTLPVHNHALNGGFTGRNGSFGQMGYHGPAGYLGMYGINAALGQSNTQIGYADDAVSTGAYIGLAHTNGSEIVYVSGVGGTNRSLGSKVVNLTGTALKFYLNASEVGTATVTGVDSTTTNFYLGAFTGGEVNHITHAAFVAAGATVAETALIEQHINECCYNMGAARPAEKVNSLAYFGDSLLVGFGATTNLANQLKAKKAFYGFHINESTLGFRATSSVTEWLDYGYHFRPDNNFWSNTTSVAFVMLGTNDLFDDQTEATIIAYLRAIWSNFQTYGYKVVAMTCPPCGSYSGAQETIRDSLNTTILADSANWDAVFDVSDHIETTLGITPSNTTYFNADTVHWNNPLYESIGDAIAADSNIQALL